jgi:hypothetical protein
MRMKIREEPDCEYYIFLFYFIVRFDEYLFHTNLEI